LVVYIARVRSPAFISSLISLPISFGLIPIALGLLEPLLLPLQVALLQLHGIIDKEELLIGLEALLIVVHHPLPGLLGLRVPIPSVGCGGLGEFVRVVILQGRWVQRLGCLLLFFLLVHLGRFRRLLIFLLWDSMGGHNHHLLHLNLCGLLLRLEWRAGGFFRFRHFIFIVIFDLFMIWVPLLDVMHDNRYWQILLAVNNNDGDFFDILGKLVKLNGARLLDEDLLHNFWLHCNSLLLTFAVVLPLSWLLHLAINVFLVISCFLSALLSLLGGLDGRGLLASHLQGRDIFRQRRLRRGDLLDEAELPGLEKGDILVLHLVYGRFKFAGDVCFGSAEMRFGRTIYRFVESVEDGT
jgi:hypothetical protein